MSKAKTKKKERNELEQWVEQHDYDRVIRILKKVREVTLTGSLEQAGQNLQRAYHFAVMSIKTKRELHELAFEMWVRGMGALDANIEAGVFGPNQKSRWMLDTNERTDWETLTLAVRSHIKERRLEELIEMQENLKGVSYSKWGFTLALCGVWEVVCIDSNVKNYFDMEGRFDLRHKNGTRDYFEMVDKIRDEAPVPVPPFVAQWMIYDMQRGEHTRHESFFQYAHPFVDE